MEVYRVTTEKWAEDILGEGARIYGGRWNHKGVPALYCSEHRSLCTLEVLVHVKLNSIPANLRLVTLHIPKEIEVKTLSLYELPTSWDGFPYDSFTQDTGTSLLKSKKTVGIRLPSSVIQQEYNVMLNPLHPDFSRVMIKDIQPLPLNRFLPDVV